ncbi:solute carrier family 23 member 1-like [Apostichopus japonicus]|uniref:solute carrier family 23 member 1-like n=1 Tax=Stichopus japonicus TaxID=307972 RepID=UPI003AB381F9
MACESINERMDDKDSTSCKVELELAVEDDGIIINDGKLLYGVDETPTWPTLIILIVQNFLMMVSGIIGIPLLLAGLVCMRSDIEAYAHLISSTFFIQGVVTFTQSTIGIRLPVIQGASFSFIPAVSSLAVAAGACPAGNDTISDMSEVWGPRLAEVNGGLLLASVFQVILGLTGLSGWILRFVGPLSIAPCIGLLGLALIDATWPSCSVHWGISLVTIFFVVLFSQYLKNINVCAFRYNIKSAPRASGQIFQLFPVIFAGVIGWIFAFILTVSGVLPDDPANPSYYARTDIGSDFIAKARWFQLPSPVTRQWPVITFAAFFGMFAGILASIVESLGDYSACAKLSEVPPPPRHAVNRGIFVEGVGCVLSGLWGTGSGTGTYSGNIVAIGMTRVASRKVTQGTAILVIIVGLFGKVTAFLASIPDPVIGGILASIIGILLSVSVTILQKSDMTSPRNLFIFGISMFSGLALPDFLEKYPDAIKTGSDQIDQILIILLRTGMFVGGVVGFFLDNTIPGTEQERGISLRELGERSSSTEQSSVYDIPFITKRIRQRPWTRFIPVCPTFGSSTQN